MSAPTLRAPAEPGSAGVPGGPARAEAGERGTLTVADRVVERIAGHAVTLVDAAAAAPRRILGVQVGEADAEDRANVQARVHGGSASVEATIAVAWPASVREVAAQTRRRIREEISRITDVRVDHVDIDVVSLEVPTASRKRVR